jgi:hypothetical protein
VGKKEKKNCWAFQKYGTIALVGNLVNFNFLKRPASKQTTTEEKLCSVS